MNIDVTLPYPRFDIPFVLSMTIAYMYKYMYEKGLDQPVANTSRSISTSTSPKYNEFYYPSCDFTSMLDYATYDQKRHSDLNCFAMFHGQYLVWHIFFNRIVDSYINMVGVDVQFTVLNDDPALERILTEMNTLLGRELFKSVTK